MTFAEILSDPQFITGVVTFLTSAGALLRSQSKSRQHAQHNHVATLAKIDAVEAKFEALESKIAAVEAKVDELAAEDRGILKRLSDVEQTTTH